MTTMKRPPLIAALVFVLAAPAQRSPAQQKQAQEKSNPRQFADPLDGRQGRELLLRNFRPQSMLRVDQTLLTRARFPVVDVHTHFRYRFRHSAEQLDDFVKLMDRHNIAVCVSLDGRLGDEFEEHKKYLWTKYRDRFVIFANIDWIGQGDRDNPATWSCHRSDFIRLTVEKLAQAKRQGASGVKIFKQFGLGYKNPDGSLIAIDDPRWDGIWRQCGKLGLPVIIHTADPAAFFLPIDEKNERWEELSRHPDWSFYNSPDSTQSPKDPAKKTSPKFPSRKELLAARNRVIARHPKTMFIGAHVANNPEDLKEVGKWLDKYPNLVVEIASRIGELGRQPYTSRKFFIKYADRVMFGTDGPWPEKRITLYWRFLETSDEYFPYSEKEFPPQGLWNIYGVSLPDEVLNKIYSENAARIIPGVAERLSRRR